MSYGLDKLYHLVFNACDMPATTAGPDFGLRHFMHQYFSCENDKIGKSNVLFKNKELAERRIKHIGIIIVIARL